MMPCCRSPCCSWAVQGDFSRSVRFIARLSLSSLSAIRRRWNSAVLAILIVLALGLPVGVYAAVRRSSPLDYFSRGMAALG